MIKGSDELQKRSVVLELSDKDCEGILSICGSHGITLSELLENFIHDLTGGSRSNGSDERELADQYISRCWFTIFAEDTMLKFLLLFYGPGVAADFVDIYDSIEQAKKIWKLMKRILRSLMKRKSNFQRKIWRTGRSSITALFLSIEKFFIWILMLRRKSRLCISGMRKENLCSTTLLRMSLKARKLKLLSFRITHLYCDVAIL